MDEARPAGKRCPCCAEEIRAQAIRCPHCGSWLGGSALHREWRRSPDGKFAGVCAGLADEFGVSVTLVRLIFVLAGFWGGLGLVAYLALWIIMPKRPEAEG